MELATTEIGSTANSYQVLAKLATGGMAEIFLARSAGGVAAVQRHVVLKRVLRDRASDINFVRMFLDEARLAAQLQHANIAQVYDVGKLGDSYFFTMEYVHGETVRSLMQRAHELRRAPPLGCVLAIAAGAAAGLHHAHTRIGIEGRPLGIVHRDVSPSNLMVGYDGSVKLVDFGVAKAADRVHETQSGAVKGKISYLSPEQARGQKLDGRSDLFALGIVMWELLTVDRLYKHDNDYETMSAIINEPAPGPSTRRPDIPAPLDRLVLRMLAKRPEERFQSAEELAEAIERVAVETGSPMSAASVSRFVREMFGNRREPWLELATQASTPEIVTVTSEPIPQELEIPINDPIDRRLAAVVDLTALVDRVTSARAAVPPPVTVTLDAPNTGVERPTTRRPVATPVTATDAASFDPDVTGRHVPAGTPTFDPGVRPALPASTSVSAEPPRRRGISPIWIATIVLALAVVAGVAIALVPGPGSSAVSVDATVAAVDPIGADAEPVVEPIADAAETAADAALDVEADAALVEPELATAPIDAGVVEPPPRAKRPPRTAPKPRGTDAGLTVSDCVDGVITDMATCTLAACRVRDIAKAKRWYVRLAVERRVAVAKSCAAAGLQLEATRPDCKANPLACPD